VGPGERPELPELGEKIEQDLWYIAHRSVLLDLRIIALTFVQVVRPRGVYGYGVENPGFVPDAEAPTTVTDRDPVLPVPQTPETAAGPGDREHHTPQPDGTRILRSFLKPELPLAATTPTSNQTMRSQP